MRLFKPSTIDTDEQIHAYTQDIQILRQEISEAVRSPIGEEIVENLEYNLKVMVLVQQRLLENR